jgi:hypothetical protein
MTPQGVVIQQTVFGFRSNADLANIVFLRYRIINRGTVVQRMDSVFFGVWQDADLGDFLDDMVGCDTSRNSGIIYNDGPDVQYGPNPPAFFSSFIQGPAVYIPGVTFIDANGNGEYDSGEVALDTAKYSNGPLLGIRRFPGARNAGMSSFVNYIQSNPDRGDPAFAVEARNYLMGKLRLGSELNPCNDIFGTVVGIPCANVPRRNWYSGDPVSRYGWLYNSPDDVRQMLNIGPFQLRQNQAVDIIVAYTLGRGSDALNSITVARSIADRAITEYRTNFSTITSVDDGLRVPEQFVLHQNYPNPFNPTTTFKFSIPHSGHVSLKVFNLLGEEVETLVDEELQAGTFTKNWNAKEYSSGVYFYRLTSGTFSETKKLVVLR